MFIGVLIAIMITIIVGVSLLPAIIDAEEAIVEDGGGVSLPAWFLILMLVIVLSALAWLMGAGENIPIGRWISDRTTQRPNPKYLKEYFSYKAHSLRDDRINLDGIVGIKIEPVDGTDEEPLQLRNGLLVLSKNFGWYLNEKHSRHILYKMVGLHRRHRNFNSVYLLGKDTHTKQPYLLRLPPSHLQRDLQECLEWCVQAGKGDIIKEV